MTSSIASRPDHLGWALADSIKWLAQQARIGESLPSHLQWHLPRDCDGVLALLESPTLHATATALEELAELPQHQEHWGEFVRLGNALDAAVSFLEHASAGRHKRSVLSKRRHEWEHRRQLHRVCGALQLFCDCRRLLQLQEILQQHHVNEEPMLPLPAELPVMMSAFETRKEAASPADKSTRYDAAKNSSRWTYPDGFTAVIGFQPRVPQPIFQHNGSDGLVQRTHDLLKTTRNVGIVGGAGIGKTTIAQAVYNCAQKQFDVRMWIRMLPCQDVLHAVLHAWSVLFPDRPVLSTKSSAEAVQALAQQLRDDGRTVLLVLDDVPAGKSSSVGNGHVASLNFATRPGMRLDGSRLIMTARDRSALPAETHTETDADVNEMTVVQVPRLQALPARQLLYQHALGASDAALPGCIPPRACTRLIRSCRGNPLALTVLGGALRSCPPDDRAMPAKWEQMAEQAIRARSNAPVAGACAAGIETLPSSLKMCLISMSRRSGSESCDRFVEEGSVLHLFAETAPMYTPHTVQAARAKLHELLQRGLILRNFTSVPGRLSYGMHSVVCDVLRRPQMAGRDPRIASLRDSIQNLKWHQTSMDKVNVHRSVQPAFPGERIDASSSRLNKKLAVINTEMKQAVIECAATVTRRPHPGGACVRTSAKAVRRWQYRSLQGLASEMMRSQPPSPAMLKRRAPVRGFSRAECARLHRVVDRNWTVPLQFNHMDLSGCKDLAQLPESVGSMRYVRHLDLSRCMSLTQLPESISGCAMLMHLVLSTCYSLSHLPEGLEDCSDLTALDLRDCCSLTHLPQHIGRCRRLEYLCVAGCTMLRRLPKSLTHCTQLKALDAADCEKLERLPHGLGSWKQLTHLCLSRCSSLKHLPASIGGCSSLQEVALVNCSALPRLPQSLEACMHLQRLSLGGCGASLLQGLPQLPPSVEIDHVTVPCTAHEYVIEHKIKIRSLPPQWEAAAPAVRRILKQHLDLDQTQELPLAEKAAAEAGESLADVSVSGDDKLTSARGTGSGVRVLARFKVNEMHCISVFKAISKEDFEDVVKLLPENTPQLPSYNMTYLIARLELHPAASIQERLTLVNEQDVPMADTVGPAVGCLMATFGTNMISSRIFDFVDPQDLKEFAVERMEIWGLQISRNAMRPVLKDVDAEALKEDGGEAEEQTVTWSPVDRLKMSVGLLYALCIIATDSDVSCGFCTPRSQLLGRWQGAGVPMKEVTNKRLIYPPSAHNFEYFKSTTVAFFLVDEVQDGLRKTLKLLE